MKSKQTLLSEGATSMKNHGFLSILSAGVAIIMSFSLTACNSSQHSSLDNSIPIENSGEKDASGLGDINEQSAIDATNTPNTSDNQNFDTDNNSGDDSENSSNTDSVDWQNNTSSKTEEHLLDEQQKNSIAMLNYLAFVSQEINDSKDSRVYLESAYTSLINNTNPDKIDESTQDHLNNMLDIIEDYRMISIKRDRLQYLYNQDKAQTIRNAIPNPLTVLSVASSLDWKRLVATVVYTAVDSYNNYKTANDELDKQFMISGWELDDEEAENIHKNRKRTFNYMIDIVRDNKLPGNLALNETSIEQFTSYVNKDNVHQKLQFLESEENTYGAFGSYWLELLDCYYEIDDFTSCLDCLKKYDDLYTGIFRRDYSYADRLPKAIVAAQNVYQGQEYISKIETLTNAIIENCENTDWALRYFAAQSYMDLYTKSGNIKFLNKAYSIAKDNVNTLVDEQKSLNDTYLNDVNELKLPESENNQYASNVDQKEQKKKLKEEQRKLDKYNESLRTKRKVECPSLYEPLVLNCELLFSLAEKLNITDDEKARIEGILQTDQAGVFISKPVNDAYSFTNPSVSSDYAMSVSKDGITVPANLLIEGAAVTVSIDNNGDKTVIQEMPITEVKREGEEISSFLALYTNNEFKKHKWSKDAKVTVTISYGDNYNPVTSNFKVVDYKDNYLLPDKVSFECID